jgi:S-DNA-T family DNA segregation ATPase FtsK/SpoIIIE
MERRYRQLAEYGVRNIDQFNLILKRGGEEIAAAGDSPEDVKPLPYVVVIIDELADLMMTSSNVVEHAIIRLSQMARAVGIHLILATQRPSVDVLTGVIKNNLPARISFRVASKVDSRVILDTQGADTLLGRGDMLFLAPGTSRLRRVHGAYVTEQEVKAVVNFWRDQGRPSRLEEVTAAPPAAPAGGPDTPPEDRDEYYEQAVQLVVAAGEASVSNIQRKLSLGYARAGRIMDMMEEEGVVGPPCGSKPRKILVNASMMDA